MCIQVSYLYMNARMIHKPVIHEDTSGDVAVARRLIKQFEVLSQEYVAASVDNAQFVGTDTNMGSSRTVTKRVLSERPVQTKSSFRFNGSIVVGGLWKARRSVTKSSNASSSLGL